MLRSGVGKRTCSWGGISAILLPFFACALAQQLSNDQLQQVVDRLAEGAQQSWELGTRAQALLELNAPFYSVFSNTSLPPPPTPPSSTSLHSNITDVIAIAQSTVSKLKNTSIPQPLVAKDGAAGDPASIGVAVLLANLTNASGENYSAAATDQLEHLLTQVPKTNDGAISHRESQVQLWSDFVYMVPPFLAYYGVMTGNQSVLAEAYNQIKLYRNYLRDPKLDNLWMHIVMGTGNDSGHWSTGNGWAAAGMLRVLATIKNSNVADQFQSEQTDLKNWVVEILNGMYAHRTKDNLFHNYADNSSTFEECSAAALVAASTYRLAVLTQTYHNLPHAEASRKTLIDGSHLDSDGWLMPVVNPENPSMNGSHSPEGQAFIVEMQAAWQDWVAIGSPGANAAIRTGASTFVLIVCFLISVTMA